MDRIFQLSSRGNLSPFIVSLNTELLLLGDITVPAVAFTSDRQDNYTFTMAYRPGGSPVAVFGGQETAAADNPQGTIDLLNTQLSNNADFLGLAIRSLTAKDHDGLLVRRVLVLASQGTPGVMPNGAVPLRVGIPQADVAPGASGTVFLMSANTPSVEQMITAENRGGTPWNEDIPIWVYFDQATGAWFGLAECCPPSGGP